MSVQSADSKIITQTTAPSDTYTRLQGRWLLFARVTWSAVVGLTVALYVLSIPIQIAQSQTLCSNPDLSQCFQAGQLTPELVHELQHMGLSLNFYVAFLTVVQVFFALVFLAVGALIFWRKSEDWMALRVSLMLVIFGLASFNSPASLLEHVYPALRFPGLLLQLLGVALLMMFFFHFPDGRFVPRWTLWLVPLILIREGINVFLPDSELGSGNIGTVLLPVEVALAVYAQIYRYRRVSGPVQRQQTKWVVYGVAAALIGYFGLIFGGALLIPRPSVLIVMIFDTLIALFILLIPLSLLVAILRYRLYEIDLLINRTLVYIPLTATLAGIFAASITLSQKLLVALTGQSSDAATVFTTLVVVAAIEPLKSGLQHLVDRRFKQARDPTQKLKALREQARAVVEILDAQQSTRRLLEDAVQAFDARGGAVFLAQDGEMHVIHTAGDWNGEAILRVPLANPKDGSRLGELALGARLNGLDYTQQDREMLMQTVNVISHAITLSERADGVRQ
jgi:hypothetical protein